MALLATLTVGNAPGGLSAGVIQNTPINGVLTLTNTGTVAVVIQSISPWATGLGSSPAPVYAQREVSTWYMTIPGGAAVAYPVSWSIPTQQIQGVGVDAVDSYFTLGATVYSTDATSPVLSPVPQQVFTTSGVPIPAGGQGGAATSSPAQGQLRYDLSFSTPTMFLW